MNKKETTALLKKISVMFPNQFDFPTSNEEQDKVTIEVWYEKLGDYEKEVILAAVDQAGEKNPDWAPTPYRVLNEIKELTDPLPKPGVALDMAKEKVNFHEIVNQEQTEPEIPDIIQDVIDAIGYRTFKENINDIRNTHILREFKEIYQDMKESRQRDKRREKLKADDKLKNLLESGESE